MKIPQDVLNPSKEDRRTAMESYNALNTILENMTNETPEIEIEETNEIIKIPLSALKLLGKLLKAMSEGKPVSLVPFAAELTTQAAAEFIGCSRPHLVKLLETGEIPFTKIGKHRRVKFEDVINYKNIMKEKQKSLIIKMMEEDENSGLYDS